MNKHLLKNLFGALLTICVLAPSLSCERLAPVIDAKQTTLIDFKNIVDKLSAINDAILNGNLTISQKMDLLKQAVDNGTITQKEGYEKIVQAIQVSAESTSSKMELLKEAILAQTTTLSDQLGILEEAIQAGIASQEESVSLMIAAIEAMSDSTSNGLDAINAALQSGTLSITSALNLIEATVKTGLTEQSSELYLIRSAIGAVNTTLTDKLTLIQNAVKIGFISQKDYFVLVEEAITTLDSNLGTAMEQLKEAITSGGELATKLAAIEAALTLGLMEGEESRLALIEEAIASLEGSLEDKFDALENAMTGPEGLSTKLVAIAKAVDTVGIDNSQALGLIKTALESLDTKLGIIDTNIGENGNNLALKADAIVAAIAAIPGTEGGAITVYELFEHLDYMASNGNPMKVPEIVMNRKLYEANDNYQFREYILGFLSNPEYQVRIGDTNHYSVKFVDFGENPNNYDHPKLDFENGQVIITKIYEFAKFKIINTSEDAAYNIQALYINDYNKTGWPENATPGSYEPTPHYANFIQTNLVFKEYYNGDGLGNYDASRNEVTFIARMINYNLSKNIKVVETCIRRRGDDKVTDFPEDWLNVDIPSADFKGTLNPIHKESSDVPVVIE